MDFTEQVSVGAYTSNIMYTSLSIFISISQSITKFSKNKKDIIRLWDLIRSHLRYIL